LRPDRRERRTEKNIGWQGGIPGLVGTTKRGKRETHDKEASEVSSQGSPPMSGPEKTYWRRKREEIEGGESILLLRTIGRQLRILKGTDPTKKEKRGDADYEKRGKGGPSRPQPITGKNFIARKTKGKNGRTKSGGFVLGGGKKTTQRQKG